MGRLDRSLASSCLHRSGEQREFRAEGSAALIAGPTTGSEVMSGIESAQTKARCSIFTHWNSPLTESQYDNTFHVWDPPGWEVCHWGGKATTPDSR